jgi:hypothetical protein
MSGSSSPAVQPAIAIPAVSLSIEQRRDVWLLKHGNVSAGTPAYWAMRARERDAIFDTDDINIISEEDLSAEPDEFTYPLPAWQAIYDLHGWTFRVQQEWKSANIGLNGHVYQNNPWRILTQESRDTWFREGVFPVSYYT